MSGRMSATAHIVAELERADLLVTAVQFGGNDVTTLARRCQSLKAFARAGVASRRRDRPFHGCTETALPPARLQESRSIFTRRAPIKAASAVSATERLPASLP